MRLKLNEEKTQIVHFRPPSVEGTRYHFMHVWSKKHIVVSPSYKYLGFWLHESGSHDKETNEMAMSASHALGILVTKFRSCGNMWVPYGFQ